MVSFSICTALALAAPVPKEKPVITCQLSITGRIGEITRADAGEVIITNNSAEVIDIGTVVGPLGYLDLKVKDAKGTDVKTMPFAGRFSPYREPLPHPLKPGESYRGPIAVLTVVPDDKLAEGTYSVKALFTFQKKTYESPAVEVKWPAGK